METTKQDFIQRKEEIEIYFNFLKILDDEQNTKLVFKDNNEIIQDSFPDKLQEILIANGFLILYNLVESTIRNSITEIYEQIKDEEITFEELTDKLKNIWIKQKAKKLKEGAYKQDTLIDSIYDIATEIMSREIVVLDKEEIDFSGNLDAQKIRKIADNYGFSHSLDGRNLVQVKEKRNRLAHGEHTFYNIGKQHSVTELNKIKAETFVFLNDVIDKVEAFLNNGRYKQ